MSNTIHNLKTEELDYIITILFQRSEALNTLINNYRRKALEIIDFDIWDTSAKEMLNNEIVKTSQSLEVASSLMVTLGNTFKFYKENLENLTKDNIKDVSGIDGGTK